MNKKIFLGLLCLFLATPLLSQGATFKTGESYYLDAKETIEDNLYAGGGDVSIAGNVNGDLYVAGGNLIISGQTGGDVAAVGGSLNIMGSVSGDTRTAGGNIVISSSIGGELVIAGGQINITQGASVFGDTKIIGGDISYSGSTGKNMHLIGDIAYINGTIVGNLLVEAREVKLGPNAKIQGDFNYFSPAEAQIQEGATVQGETNFNQTNAQTKGTSQRSALFGFLTFGWILKSLMLIVAGLILLYFFKNLSGAIIQKGTSNFWMEALKGFIILVVLPIAIILSFITVVGMFVGLISLFFYVALIILASVYTALIFAQLSLKYIFKKEPYEINWWVVILAVLVLGLISVIPFIGWIFTFIIFLSAFGSTASYIFAKFRGQ